MLRALLFLYETG